MRARRFIPILVLLLLLVGSEFREIAGSPFDSPFSVYAGDALWAEETVFLENFAIYLKEDPEMIGLIVYFSSKKIPRAKLEKRMRRSIKFLTKDHKLRRGRLWVYYGGWNEDSKIVLQPIKAEGN